MTGYLVRGEVEVGGKLPITVFIKTPTKTGNSVYIVVVAITITLPKAGI